MLRVNVDVPRRHHNGSLYKVSLSLMLTSQHTIKEQHFQPMTQLQTVPLDKTTHSR